MRHVTIRIPAESNLPPVSVNVSYSPQKYKRAQNPCHYYLEDLGAHIFVLGMMFLSPDQRTKTCKDIGQKDIDEDYIPWLFRKGGIEELRNLHGEHNIIVVSEKNGDITFQSSRFGLLPLYYALVDGNLCVSDSLAVVGKASGLDELNKDVLVQLCLYNYSLTNDSLLEGCYALPASTCLRFSQGTLNLETFWTPEQLLNKDIIHGKDSVDLIDEAFQGAVKRYAGQVDQTALSLTGGWDGRLILAYILQEMDSEKIQLYSFGTAGSPDVIIPKHIASMMSLRYKAYLLDQEYLDASFIQAAINTAMFSDGYRSIQRAHYLYAMQDLASDHASVMSGICGSNVMKTAATTPSVVMNARILQLLSSNDPEQALSKHLAVFKNEFAPHFNDVHPEDFKRSVLSPELSAALKQESYAHKASCFVFGILERKYFGPEIASYRHLVGNYSPFIDRGFIDALSRTEYFNAYRASGGIFSNRSNAVLYARLMWRHNKILAGFTSDKYIRLSDLLHPTYYPVVALKQLYRRKIRRHIKQSNPYNTEDTLQRFLKAYPDLWKGKDSAARDRNMLGSFLSAVFWHNRSFSGVSI
jgi:hypothetical protein